MARLVEQNYNTSFNGNVDIVIEHDGRQVRIEDVMIVDDDADALEGAFHEAVELAKAGEEGYTLLDS